MPGAPSFDALSFHSLRAALEVKWTIRLVRPAPVQSIAKAAA